ncbi:MAG: tryptophan--tRNA ligase [Bacteroidia bacterium]|nr:tryptophan--tRNA ligase [Bacteroidia bacterium]
MKKVVSGIRPTGKLHLGNYFGAIKNFIRMQNEFESYFFIADYHSLTTHPTPQDLHESVRRVFAEYLALGLDPDKCTLYIQSDLPQTAELYMFFNMNAYMGELQRLTSFKDKIRSQPDNVNAGLLTYPTLMAADILLHKGELVPVGKDQEQHLEMTRTFGNRFNRLYNVEYFPEPQAFNYNDELVKVPGLTGGGKMSKSAGEFDNIYMSDSEDLLRKKIMKAVTTTVDGPSEIGSSKPQSIQNLFELMNLVCQKDVIQHFESSYYDGSIRFGDLKKQLADDMALFIAPFRNRIEEAMNNPQLVADAARKGAEKASESANNTIQEVRQIIGFKKFY